MTNDKLNKLNQNSCLLLLTEQVYLKRDDLFDQMLLIFPASIRLLDPPLCSILRHKSNPLIHPYMTAAMRASYVDNFIAYLRFYLYLKLIGNQGKMSILLNEVVNYCEN